MTVITICLRSIWISFQCGADPRFFNADTHKVSAQLAPVLGIPESEILASLQKDKRQFIWLARDLTYDHLTDIQSIIQPIRGLKYQIHERRFYPKDNHACHIIGHTNFANEGVYGIEHLHDAHLLGAANDARGETSKSPQKLNIPTDGKKRPNNPKGRL